jgi:hypothetical protein
MTIKIDPLQAAVEAAKKNDHAGLLKLRAEIDGLIRASGAQATYDQQRAKKLQTALSNPEEPQTRQALATLSRLGLSPHQASDIDLLNTALDARRWSTEERLRVKFALSHHISGAKNEHC